MKYSKIPIVVCILLGTLCFSCKRKVSVAEYMENYKQAGITQEFTSENYQYILQYQSPEFIILNENKGQLSSKDSFVERKMQLENFVQFRLRLIPLNKNASDGKEYAYFHLEDFELQDRILLHSEGQSYKTDFVHRQDEANGMFSLLMSFPISLKDDLELECKDLEIPAFHIDYKEIRKLPQLKMQ